MKVITSVRALTVFFVVLCAAGSAAAETPDEAVTRAAEQVAEEVVAADASAVALELAGLKARLKLRPRFDWIRSYTALGPHLYLASTNGARTAWRG